MGAPRAGLALVLGVLALVSVWRECGAPRGRRRLRGSRAREALVPPWPPTAGPSRAAAVSAGGLLAAWAPPAAAAVATAPEAASGPGPAVLLGVAAAAAALAAFNSEVVSLYTRTPTATQRAGGFRYYVSRNKPNFNRAFQGLAAEYPGFRSDAVFVYFCGYGGKRMPELAPAPRYVEVIDVSVTEEFDDKGALARNLQAAGCEGAFPATFFGVEEALRATSGAAASSTVFFLKSPCDSGGGGIELVTRTQLAAGHSVPDGHIIQQSVQDLDTIEGRKFVLRFFLVVHDGRLYLHRRGMTIVHDKPYDRESVDFDVQCHRSFSDGGAQLLVSHELPGFDERYAALRRRVIEILPALQPLLDASSEERYTVIGGDAVIESTGEARLIELNMFPNMGLLTELGRDFNLFVITPMLTDALAAILVGDERAELERLA